jgi:hypothetical protein
MRMRQDPGESPAGGNGAYFPAHAHAGANGEASSLRDEQLGQIFRNMRLTMKVSRETIARRLATSTASIDTFEAGAIGALPHGKETERIVRGYCELLRLDPEPILWRIRGHMQTLASPPATPMPTTAPPSVAAPATVGRPATRSQTVARSERTQGGRSKAERTQTSPLVRRRRARALFALSTPVALIAALVYLAHAAPQPIYRAVALLPGPAEPAVRAGVDYVVLLAAPRREGLRWIEMGDPRLRKADKLQTSAR